MLHCGLGSKVRAMKYHKGCHSWANSACILQGFHWALHPFLIHLTLHCLPLFLFHTWKQCQSLWLPLVLSSVAAIKDVINPVDVVTMPLVLPILPVLPGNLFFISLAVVLWSQWLPESSCVQLARLRELGQLGSLTTRITATHSPSSTAHQDKEFSTSNPRKSLQVPSHHSNCCFILGHKTELFSNPWLSVTTSSSKWVVWIYHWFDC